MSQPTTITDQSFQLRWAVYSLLIATSIGSMIGRILAVDSGSDAELTRFLARDGHTERPLPLLGANDISRWATARSLVDKGTYAIEDIVVEKGWHTVDMVCHGGWDGRRHLYSSKPPLFATLIAGEYWIINRLTGATLSDRPYEIVRFMLVTINVLPMVIYFIVLAHLIERFGTTDWSRIYVMMYSSRFLGIAL